MLLQTFILIFLITSTLWYANFIKGVLKPDSRTVYLPGVTLADCVILLLSNTKNKKVRNQTKKGYQADTGGGCSTIIGKKLGR